MPITEQTGASPDRLTAWAPLGIALVLIFSMMSDIEEWLYVAVVIGLVASLAVGRTSGKPEQFSMQARLFKFAKGWSLVVALAALSLLHGTWQPMVFFALFGALSTACFWLGCKSSR